MSQVVGLELSADLFNRLNGEDIASKAGKAIVLLTVDHQGRAHPAMLSYYEVVAKDLKTIDLAIGKTSTTAGNLRRTGKVTFLITDRGVNFYVKAHAREIKESMEAVAFMSLFRAEIDEILEDQEPDAMITSGVTFSRPQKKEVSVIVEKIFQGVRSGR